MVYYDPRKPKPWPIRLLNRWGVTDDNQATVIIFFGVTVMLLATFFIYASTLSPENNAAEPLDDLLLKEMEEGLEIDN